MFKKLAIYCTLFLFTAVGCQQPDPTPTATLSPPTAAPTESISEPATIAPTVTLAEPTIPSVATFTPVPTSTRRPEQPIPREAIRVPVRRA
jgi:hypothetical protein